MKTQSETEYRVPRRAFLACLAALSAFPSTGVAAEINTRVFDAVWRRVDGNYYDSSRTGAQWDAMRTRYRPLASAAASQRDLYAVLNRMLASLEDRHAVALPPTLVRNQLAERDGRSVSVGLTLRPVEGALVVSAVHSGSPAWLAGVRPGWMLVEVDGAPVDPRAFTPDPPHNAVFLDQHDGRVDVRLEAREFDYAPVRTATRSEDGGLVVAFDGFVAGLSEWFANELRRADPAGLILDLRGNSGGQLTEMHKTLDLLFEGRVDYGFERTRAGRARSLVVAGSGPGAFKGPVVVLVDDGSVSAAELAGAMLQESRRAVVVGQQSAGSVLLAWRTSLPDGGQLRLSERDLVLRSGLRLEGAGVTPDRVVRRSLQDWRTGRDPALAVAREQLAAELASKGGVTRQ